MPLPIGSLFNNASTALEASRVIVAGPAVLHSITVLNTSASNLYLQLFDAASLPNEGAFVSGDIVPINAGQISGFDYGELGKGFANGIVAVLSSTAGTKTIAGAVGQFYPRYRV